MQYIYTYNDQHILFKFKKLKNFNFVNINAVDPTSYVILKFIDYLFKFKHSVDNKISEYFVVLNAKTHGALIAILNKNAIHVQTVKSTFGDQHVFSIRMQKYKVVIFFDIRNTKLQDKF